MKKWRYLFASIILIPIFLTPMLSPPTEFNKTLVGTLVEGDRSGVLATIPAGVINLKITLTATADIDLELYDGDTLAIGWKGEVGSAPGGIYQDDTFAYSGYKGSEEYISTDSPLSQSYDLGVYAYKAGSYTVDVFYAIPDTDPAPPPDEPPPATLRKFEDVDELRQWLAQDKTDEIPYTSFFNCNNFSSTLQKAGFVDGYIINVYPLESGLHILNMVAVGQYSYYWVEPQDDKVYYSPLKLEEVE